MLAAPAKVTSASTTMVQWFPLLLPAQQRQQHHPQLQLQLRLGARRHGSCGRASRNRAAKLGGTAARGHEGHVRAGAHPVARDLRGQGAADPRPLVNES